MAKKTVKARVGDSLCNIAYLNGFGDCKPLREEPANAYILNRTEDPGQLHPGDVVTIPEFQIRDESGGTEATHKYVRRGTLAMLRFVHGSASATVAGDATLSFLNVSNFVTNKAGTPDGNVAFPGSGVRSFNSDADKDPDVFKVEVLDIKATGDLDVELEMLKPKYDAAGKLNGHERFPGAVRGPRQPSAVSVVRKRRPIPGRPGGRVRRRLRITIVGRPGLAPSCPGIVLRCRAPIRIARRYHAFTLSRYHGSWSWDHDDARWNGRS